MSSVVDFMIKPKLRSQTATASQTIITLTSISVPGADQEKSILIINGKEQPYGAYTVDSSTQITIPDGLESGDHVEVKIPSY